MAKFVNRAHVMGLVQTGRLAAGDNAKSAERHVKALPVVEVVRCKECRNYDEKCGIFVHYCKMLRRSCPNDGDFFCACGERKDTES